MWNGCVFTTNPHYADKPVWKLISQCCIENQNILDEFVLQFKYIIDLLFMIYE